jgi:hypothetical protein
MFGAAKMNDMALLQQLLRCMEAADLQLSTAGHTALLHSLARADRPCKALQWLQESVPAQLLTSNMVRMLVQPLLQQGHVAAAEQALRWAAGRMKQPEQTGDLPVAAAGLNQQQQQQQVLLHDDLQVLPCMRLAVAAAKGTLGAVQAEWAAIQQEQQEQQQLQQPQQYMQQVQHAYAAGCDPHLLSVSVWAAYVDALGRVGRKDPGTVHSLMQGAVEQLADVYHASAWSAWAQRTSRSQQQQQQQHQQQHQQQQPDGLQQQQPWLVQARQQALQAWQQVKQLDDLGWQHLNPPAVLPQQVAHSVRAEDRDRLRSALHVALQLASSQLDKAWMQRLLKLSALLKVSPRERAYDSIFSMRLWQGAPPETLEVRPRV